MQEVLLTLRFLETRCQVKSLCESDLYLPWAWFFSKISKHLWLIELINNRGLYSKKSCFFKVMLYPMERNWLLNNEAGSWVNPNANQTEWKIFFLPSMDEVYHFYITDGILQVASSLSQIRIPNPNLHGWYICGVKPIWLSSKPLCDWNSTFSLRRDLE